MRQINRRARKIATQGDGQDAAELARQLLDEKLAEEARWEPRSSPYTSTRYADELPEADFYGYDGEG